jgi:hypothetical protein
MGFPAPKPPLGTGAPHRHYLNRLSKESEERRLWHLN